MTADLDCSRPAPGHPVPIARLLSLVVGPLGWPVFSRRCLVPFLLVVSLVLCSADPAQAGSSYSVGSFTKSTGAAPVSQNVPHNLGETPKALILWTNGKTNESFSAHFLIGLGFTDGATDLAVSAASQDAVSKTDCVNRVTTKAISIVQWDSTVLAEANRTSWDSTNFTLQWTTNNSTAYVIHFLAIGGSDISAKVLNWQMKQGATGNHPVTGVGFKPNVVLHAFGSDATTSLPGATSGHAFGFGAMDADGDEWVSSSLSADNGNTANTDRGQQTDACIYLPTSSGTVDVEASWVSMDTDGFTTNFSSTGTAGQVIALALKGLNVKVGKFNKSTGGAPASQSVSDVGFQPSVVLLSSFQDVTQASPVAEARYGIGASDGTTEGSSAFQDQDNVSTTNVDGIDKTSKVFMKVNNATPSIDAEADLTSLDSGGFTLNWTTNDAVATEMLYLAMGPLAATAAEMRSFTATDSGDGVLLEWRTGYEAQNLGFHVYREERGRLVRVTPSLVAGSALLAEVALTAGRSYQWWDPAGRAGARYWLEDVDLDGGRAWHEPVTAAAGGGIFPARRHAPLLSRLGGVRSAGTHVVERRAGSPRRTRARLRQRAAEAAAAGVKLGVRAEGWYRVAQETLVGAGLDPLANPDRLRLVVDGEEQRMTVVGGEDGTFDPGDAVEFYGLGRDTPWTDTRTYWLLWGGQWGARIRVVSDRGKGHAPPPSFPLTVERKDREVYFGALKNGEAANFFGPVVGTDPVVQALDVHHLDAASPADVLLEVVLQGVTTDAHRVGILLNGIDVGEAVFAGQVRYGTVVPLFPGDLAEGENEVTLVARGGEADVSLVDVIRLTYPHTYTADGDALRCTAPGGRRLRIGGFHSPDIRVLDVTHPDDVRELAGEVEAVEPAGEEFTIAVTVSGAGDRELLAVAGAGVKEPAEIAADTPSQWASESVGAEMVIVAHRDFLGSAEQLAARRAAQGWSVAVVDIEDLYDEFSFGAKTPWALREFLLHAQARWEVPPGFVVLVGEASLDPRNYLGLGEEDFVPTGLVETAYLETASDDWFGDRDEDGVPEMAVGRLPVRTAAEADAVVAKIAGYEEAPDGGGWTRDVLLVADDTDVFDFAAATDEVAALLPLDMTVEEISLDETDFATARAALLDRLDAGQLLVNYFGHGSVEVWTGQGLLDSADAALLTNGPRCPVVVSMTCLNGFFHDVYSESLAEALVRAPAGGAVAVWASSGLTGPEEQAALDQAFIAALVATDGLTLGEAAMVAKAAVTDSDVRRTWILLGDPTLQLR